MWRLTKQQKYRDWGWEAVQVNTYCTTLWLETKTAWILVCGKIMSIHVYEKWVNSSLKYSRISVLHFCVQVHF
jgi:hypothetical protein